MPRHIAVTLAALAFAGACSSGRPHVSVQSSSPTPTPIGNSDGIEVVVVAPRGIAAGTTAAITIQVRNRGSRTWYRHEAQCGSPAMFTSFLTDAFRPEGRTWPGVLGDLKSHDLRRERPVAPVGALLMGPSLGTTCADLPPPSKIALPPGGEFQEQVRWRAVIEVGALVGVRNGRLPTGPATVRAALFYTPTKGDLGARTASGEARTTVSGGLAHSLSPGMAIDTAFEQSRVKTWVARHLQHPNVGVDVMGDMFEVVLSEISQRGMGPHLQVDVDMVTGHVRKIDEGDG